MALKRGGLGRGLDSLIPDKKKEQTAKQSASSKDEVKAAKRHPEKKQVQKRKRNLKMKTTLQHRVRRESLLMKVLTSQFFRRMRHGKQTRSILKQVMRPGLLI